MDPELLQSIADEHGLPVQHFDGYSVVGHPDGPMTIAHPPGARVPARALHRVVLTEPMAISAPSPAPAAVPPPHVVDPRSRAEIDASIAEDNARMQRDSSFAAARGRSPREEAHRDAQVAELRAPHVGPSGELSPDEQALDRQYRDEMELQSLRASGRLAGLQDAHAAAPDARAEADVEPTGAGTTTLPDGTQIDTATGQPLGALPPGVPPSWLRDPVAGLREGARSAQAADLAMRTPAPITSTSLPTVPGIAPMGQEQAPPAAAPQGPIVTQRRGGGAQRVAPSRGAAAPPQGPALPGAASDATIAGLAGDYAGPRRDPDAIDRQYLVESQRAGLAGRAAQTQAQLELQAEQQRQQIEQERQQATAGAIRAYQNAIARVASERLDPSRWYRDQGAGGVVSATIAVALGALGQAFTGSSTNSALDQINQAIDRDIDAQRSDIEGGRAAASMQGNMIGIMGQEFSDRQAAQDAARAAMLHQAALQVQQHEAELQDDEARNNAEALRQQLADAAAERQQAAVDRELQQRLTAAQVARTEAQARHEMRLAGGAGRPHAVTPTQLDAYRQIVHNSPQIDPAEAAQLAGLPAGYVPENAVDPTTVDNIQALEGELSHLEALVPAEGTDVPGVGATGWVPDLLTSDEGRAVRRSARQVIELLGRLHSGGVISPDEQTRFTALIGAGATQSDQDLRAGIETIRRELGSRLQGRPSSTAATDREIDDLGGRWVE